MAPSSKIRHRFQNSLDMVAARSTLVDLTRPSGTDNAWSMVDSPTLGRRPSFAPRRIELIQGEPSPIPSPLPRLTINIAPLEPRKVDVSPLSIKKANGSSSAGENKVTLSLGPIPAPLDIKKIRRRALTTNVRLVLPPSPLPPPRSPVLFSPALLSPNSATTPQTGLTFTAEWDLNRSTFVFTPFETSYPLSAISPVAKTSPIPDDVASEVITVAESRYGEDEQTSPASPSSSISSRYSDIFDTPISPSIYSTFSHERRPSTASTATPLSTTEMSFKPEASSSSSSLNHQVTVQLFEDELHRTLHTESRTDFDKGCYEEMDEDLLMAPMDVFTQMLWESTEETPIPIVPQEVVGSSQMAAEGEKVIPDVPSNASLESMPHSHEAAMLRRHNLPPRLIIPPPPQNLPMQPPKTSSRPRRRRNFSDDLVHRLQIFMG